MHRILLTNPRIGSYSAFLLLGLLAGYILVRWRASRAGIKGAHIDNLTLLIAILSLFGARLFSWIFYFPRGVSFWQALRDPGGGMVFYGGVIFGFLTLIIYARITRLSFGNLLDVFAPGLALGLALGRIGCFMAGGCWGDICADESTSSRMPASATWQTQSFSMISRARFPLAVRFPSDAGAFEQHRRLDLLDHDATLSLSVHPVQLYEAALALALCIVLHRFFERRRWEGQVFCLLIAGYAVIRFGTEFLRADNAPIYLGLTLSQVISISSGMMAILALVWKSRSIRESIPIFEHPAGGRPIPPGFVSHPGGME